MVSITSSRGEATCTAADRAGGSREEASSEVGRCMAVKTALVGPGIVEAAGLGIAAEREARTTAATTRGSIHAIIAGAWATGSIKTSIPTTEYAHCYKDYSK